MKSVSDFHDDPDDNYGISQYFSSSFLDSDKRGRFLFSAPVLLHVAD